MLHNKKRKGAIRIMIESDYDYRYERKEVKPIRECTECGTGLYEGDRVFVIGNKIYCNDCVREVELGSE